MKPALAEQNLQLIRTLMERSTLYRRALAPMMLWAGAVACLAAWLGWHFQLEAQFIGYWLAICLVVILGATVLARRQAIRDQEPFWSPPLRRVVQAMAPVLVVGLIWTATVARSQQAAIPLPLLERSLGPATLDLVALWSLLYGCALHAAGLFAPPSLRRAGWAFIGAGAALLIWGGDYHGSRHLLMGLIFGGLHLAGAAYLLATEKRASAA